MLGAELSTGTQQDVNVRYWYDDYSDSAIFYDYSGPTTYAIGQRTGMLDASGHSMWAYDARWRLIREEKVVLNINGGTFVTRWGYNSADLPTWMKYPLNNIEGEGETVHNTYYPQLAVDRVYGTNIYVDNTDYDPTGRVDRRMLGASPFITQDYVYNAWNVQGGRIAQLKTGYSTVLDSLQDLRYTYDLAGNVLTISDYKAGGIQTQTFEYDDLDRLVSAVASGGTGGTYALQNYSYDTNGRLASNAGVTYSYNNPAHVHAVTGTSDGRSYGYDANGNQTTRTVGGQTYTLSYDAENRLVGVSGTVSATFVYDGDGNRVKSIIGTTNTVYIDGYFEWSGSSSTMRRYYYAGGQRIAMRLGTTTLRFLLGDHLGSTSHHRHHQRIEAGRAALLPVGRGALFLRHHPNRLPLYRSARGRYDWIVLLQCALV